MTTLASFEAAEAEWWKDEQRKLDRVRVRGYTLACIKRVESANVEMQRAISCLQNAQSVADNALKKLRHELEHAEEMGRLVALDDPEVNERLALALEQLAEVE